MPYLLSEEKNEIDVWYIDESSFNVCYTSNYGYAKVGLTPYINNVPIKETNLSLIAAICRNKKPYY